MHSQRKYIAEFATNRAMRMGLSIEATGQYVEMWLDAWEDYVLMLGKSASAMDLVATNAQSSARVLGLTVQPD
jgi:hypothetical protein